MTDVEQHLVMDLIKLAQTLGSFQQWTLQLIEEVQAQRVPDWESERKDRVADIKRRIVDLEELCHKIRK